MDEELEKEKELIFRRFHSDKQEQIRQLVAYTTLMGLTGKDLVSIGGKLDRLEQQNEEKRNVEIALNYMQNIVPVGKTKTDRDRNKYSRWVYTDSRGGKWEFATNSLWSIDIINRATNRRKQFYVERFFQKRHQGAAPMYNALLNLHHGKILLNF